jgi:hypothetical protein
MLRMSDRLTNKTFPFARNRSECTPLKQGMLRLVSSMSAVSAAPVGISNHLPDERPWLVTGESKPEGV